MKKKPLSQTNVHLRDLEKRQRDLVRSVVSSSAVEGIRLKSQDVADLQRSVPKVPILPSDSAR